MSVKRESGRPRSRFVGSFIAGQETDFFHLVYCGSNERAVRVQTRAEGVPHGRKMSEIILEYEDGRTVRVERKLHGIAASIAFALDLADRPAIT